MKSAIENATSALAYPQVVPESASTPFVVYARVGTARDVSMPVGAVSPVGTFTVEIYAETYSLVKSLADSVRVALSSFNGTASGATITSVLLQDERDGEPVFFNGQDKPTYMVEHTYIIRWTE
jgi:hypothetical protein